ncbi:hypothetical protein GWI33_020902 [Rhynchophorus ferrugineus]|uniref:Kazal-like domain-containing protein n=1 Tax=Rhynchophorus ferrugineus TaxID=354439 RepID=A0A834HNX2_RHYFE|nr:hypothetical protein GWI33_020902 [Rhynchophorus ferrugineus]
MKSLLICTVFIFIAVAISNTFEIESPDGLPVCVCTRIYMPVCASDGKTYGNQCEMECESSKMLTRGLEKLRVLKEGYCDSDDFSSNTIEEDLANILEGNIPIEPVVE